MTKKKFLINSNSKSKILVVVRMISNNNNNKFKQKIHQIKIRKILLHLPNFLNNNFSLSNTNSFDCADK